MANGQGNKGSTLPVKSLFNYFNYFNCLKGTVCLKIMMACYFSLHGCAALEWVTTDVEKVYVLYFYYYYLLLTLCLKCIKIRYSTI